MRAPKVVVVAVFGLVAGGLLLGTGYHNFRETRQLQREAASIDAKVVDARTQYRGKGRSRRYLTVEFHTQSGQLVTKETEVDFETHQSAVGQGRVLVHYLPGDPSILRAGSAVEPEYRNILLGALLLACGGISLYFIKSPGSREEPAANASQLPAASTGLSHQYARVNGAAFKGVDQKFYESIQGEFEALGFVHLEDIEVIPTKPAKGFARTFVRLLLSADGTRVANIFHVKPGLALRLIGAKESRVYGIDTQMTDDSFVCTDNAETCPAGNPPDINAAHLPTDSTVAMVADAHANRVEAHSVFRMNATPVRIRNAEDARRAMHLQNRIKADFLKTAALKRAGLEDQANGNERSAANELRLDLGQNREQARREAA